MSLQYFSAARSASKPFARTSSLGSDSRWFQCTESTTPGTFRPVSSMHRFASSTVRGWARPARRRRSPALSAAGICRAASRPQRTMPIFTAFLNFLSVGFSSAPANSSRRRVAVAAMVADVICKACRRVMSMAASFASGSGLVTQRGSASCNILSARCTPQPIAAQSLVSTPTTDCPSNILIAAGLLVIARSDTLDAQTAAQEGHAAAQAAHATPSWPMAGSPCSTARRCSAGRPHSKADWQVKDGAIFVSGGEKGLLCTTVEFDNYVLKADFRAAKNTNSGIFLRTAPVVGMNDITTKCYELNIAPPDNPFPTGSFVGRQKGKTVPEKAGEWQSYEVTLDGAKVDRQAQRRNGPRIHRSASDAAAATSACSSTSGQVEFKNIKLKPLGLQPLFNGKDLTGWKNHPESKSTFTVNDKGEIHVTSTGRGALESEKQFGDFVSADGSDQPRTRAEQRPVHSQHSGRIRQRLREPDSQRHQGRRPDGSRRILAPAASIAACPHAWSCRTTRSGSTRRSWPTGRTFRCGSTAIK